MTVLDNLIVGRVEPRIYAFTTNTIPDYLKVGDTYRPVSVRLNEWKLYFPELIKQYENKAMVADDIYFRDYAVHRFLESEKRLERLKQQDIDESTYYSNEFFKGASADDVCEAVADIASDYENKTGKYQFYNAESRLSETFKFKRTENYEPRPNQKNTIEAFKAAVDGGRTNLLMYAVMRFGKSFTSMCCAVEMGADFVVIVSAKADVMLEWKKTVESHVKFADYDFITSENLLRDSTIIPDKLSNGRKVVVFLTLQDLQGDTKKDKHLQVFDRPIDLLIVDETHFGARAAKYGAVLRGDKDATEKCDKEESFTLDDVSREVKVLRPRIKLHLSGTPYRILMGSEFSKEDIIAFYQFADIMHDQKDWDDKHILCDDVQEWDNPYYGFPQMLRFAFNPNESSRKQLEKLRESGSTYAFSALFKPKSIKRAGDGSHKKFVYEREILELLEVIDGSKEDDELLGFLDYDKIKKGKMCRHIVCVLPYCASCDALEALIHDNADKFRNLNDYEIINISGVDRPQEYRTPRDIKSRIQKYAVDKKKTITLTVNRMLTGSTVPEWDTMLFLKDTASPQEYDQAIFRLQNQYIKTCVNKDGPKIKLNEKPQTLLVDFDPNRMFFMQEQKAQIYNVFTGEAGNNALSEKIRDELSISPIIVLNRDKIEQIVAKDILEAVGQYSRSRGVAEETQDIPVDLSLMEVEAIRKAIERENELGSKAGLTISNAEGEGRKMDVPEGEKVARGPESPVPEAPKADKQKGKDPAKQFRSYYARILFFAFLTKNKVISLEEVIGCMDEDNNRRIAHNLGIMKVTLESILEKADKFMIRALDYKIQNINRLSHDDLLRGYERAVVAVHKFGKLGESEVITPQNICDDMVGRIPKDGLRDALDNGHKILDIAGKAGEFALAVYNKCVDMGYGVDDFKDAIYTIPTSGLTYEFTRFVYEALGLNVSCIAEKFTAYDLLNVKISPKKKSVDYDKVCDLLSQNKPFNEIAMKDEVAKGDEKVKIGIIVGNPPYHETKVNTSDSPIYHLFMDLAFNIAAKVVFITPGKFLFNAGKTPKTWNEKILNDEHLKVIWYKPDNTGVFPNVEIKGGVTVTFRDANQNFGGIGLYSTFSELNSILKKVKERGDFTSICNKIYLQNKFQLEILYNDYPSFAKIIGSGGKERRLTTSIFKQLPIFTEKQENDSQVGILGLIDNKRVMKYIDKKYIEPHGNLMCYKVIVPKSNGSGAFGEVVSTPVIGPPVFGHTQTFISIGAFDTDLEANSLLKYIKSKFARCMLGTLKVTQDNNISTWANIPVQDFTANSDIDWTQSISDIDRQLYAKYGLSDDEIEFIESHVQSMEQETDKK